MATVYQRGIAISEAGSSTSELLALGVVTSRIGLTDNLTLRFKVDGRGRGLRLNFFWKLARWSRKWEVL